MKFMLFKYKINQNLVVMFSDYMIEIDVLPEELYKKVLLNYGFIKDWKKAQAILFQIINLQFWLDDRK